VQFDGKTRGRVRVPGGAGEAAVLAAVLADGGSLGRHAETAGGVAGLADARCIFVPGKIINFVWHKKK
jgi:hypothetical protein